jgi:hypothetical protein
VLGKSNSVILWCPARGAGWQILTYATSNKMFSSEDDKVYSWNDVRRLLAEASEDDLRQNRPSFQAELGLETTRIGWGNDAERLRDEYSYTGGYTILKERKREVGHFKAPPVLICSPLLLLPCKF